MTPEKIALTGIRRKSSRRVNPYGLLRLLIVAVVFALLALGHGLSWWIGFSLLTAVLITLSGNNMRPIGPWLGSIGLIFLAFVHVGIIPFLYGIIPMTLLFVSYFALVFRRLAG